MSTQGVNSNALAYRTKALDNMTQVQDYLQSNSGNSGSFLDAPLPLCTNNSAFANFGAMNLMSPMTLGCPTLGMGMGMGMDGLGMGMGMMNPFGCYSPEQVKEMIKYQREISNLQKTDETEDMAIARKVGQLQRYIQDNELDKAKDLYAELETLVQKRNDLDSQDLNSIKAKTDEAYYDITKGHHITQDVQEYGDSSFINGLKKGTGVGYVLTNHTNADELAAEVDDTSLTTGKKALKYVGGAITLAAVALTLPFALKGGKFAAGGALHIFGDAWKSLFK